MEKVETQNLASHEGKSIYSSAYNCLQDCYGVDGRCKILRLTSKESICSQRIHRMRMWDGRDGRRKILRLYKACAIIVIDCLFFIPLSHCCSQFGFHLSRCSPYIFDKAETKLTAAVRNTDEV